MIRPEFATLLLAVTTGHLLAADPASKQTIRFADDIGPIFSAHCVRCHGPQKQHAGFRLDDSTQALQGGDSGAVILPGKSGQSPLIQRVSSADPGEVMPPPKAGRALTAAEVELLKAWIDQGAIWPRNSVGSRSDHWSFQPIARPAMPAVVNADSVRNAVDGFILSRLERDGVAPSPEADRPTLLRRLSLDLTGLPPTPDEVRTFLEDLRPEAYERQVDRLLASPNFGERWARHWLDLARYADTDGYSGEQYRPWAWRWRRWVIDAWNADLPFDLFTIHQLAGDLLPTATIDQRIATGFHRNWLHSREMDADKEEFRVRKVVDAVNVTATTWLGVTMGCAQCHSHKFDPISQREYFGLYAFFNSLEEEDAPAALAEPGRAFAISSADAAKPLEPRAQVLLERAEPRPTRIHLRGDFLAPGDEVEPHVPSLLPKLHPRGPRPDRLDLARWLVSPEHPLTARVAVNRVWQQLFGRGLVRTENDFGSQGEKPSHPELLDWLASEFMDMRWSHKSLIRLLVTSSTYRQAAAAHSDVMARDPENRLLARQNRLRLEAEIVRDSALHAAGLLDRRVGGPSFRPRVPPDAGEVVGTQWKNELGPDRYRRGLYIVVQRTIPLPFLAAFDTPDGNSPCTRRDRTNTPIQALTLLNDPLFVECAERLGKRLAALPGDDASRLKAAWSLMLVRAPAPDELDEMQAVLAEQRRLLPDPADQAAAWAGIARILMNTDEFVTRE